LPDYDVAALGLSSPPASAPKQTYTPGILVKNQGLHVADVIGTIAIFDKALGVQVFYSEVVLTGLGAGNTGTAQALTTWTPDKTGPYYAFGYVTTDPDNVPQNGQLPPTNFTVTDEPPTPPSVVPNHATQHEAGSSDEIDVGGLSGQLKDQQRPTNHASDHELGGADELSVDGLSGRLSTPQMPVTHGNGNHAPWFTSIVDFGAHTDNTIAHTLAQNLAKLEISGPDAGFVVESQLADTSEVPRDGFDEEDNALAADRTFKAVNPVLHAFSHEPGGSDEISQPPEVLATGAVEKTILFGDPSTLIIGDAIPAAYWTPNFEIFIKAYGLITTAAGAGQFLNFVLAVGGVTIISTSLALPPSTTCQLETDAILHGRDDSKYSGFIRVLAQFSGTSGNAIIIAPRSPAVALPTADKAVQLWAGFTGGVAGTSLGVSGASMTTLRQL
jgi:hypothetical protein